MISTSHGLPHRRSWLCLNLHLPWTPIRSAVVIKQKYFIYTSYGLHPLLIIAPSFIIISFNLHLPWTSTISPYNSVCYNLHLSWNTGQQKANYVWIFTSQGLLYTVQKLYMYESPPPTNSRKMSRRFYIVNLHLEWRHMDYLLSPPLMDYHTPPPFDFYNLSI